MDGHSDVVLPDPISNSEVKRVHVPSGTALCVGTLDRCPLFSKIQVFRSSILAIKNPCVAIL